MVLMQHRYSSEISYHCEDQLIPLDPLITLDPVDYTWMRQQLTWTGANT